MYLYWASTKSVTRGGRYAMAIFGIVMLTVQGAVFFGPPPVSPQAAAVTALAAYFGFAGVAYWLEKKQSAIGSMPPVKKDGFADTAPGATLRRYSL
jgi:hypothetical protein